ncbi:hypothetical protein QVD17_23129 [Tagetes erecta]|uniref:Uncharacterized protein n=1 Tax=Tagetes erecta TaxID=13708 RepID=A0AAD8KGS4_TARER|nr:hypothetical protein QVD17_23129 [Tagetes erecta]
MSHFVGEFVQKRDQSTIVHNNNVCILQINQVFNMKYETLDNVEIFVEIQDLLCFRCVMYHALYFGVAEQLWDAFKVSCIRTYLSWN